METVSKFCKIDLSKISYKLENYPYAVEIKYNEIQYHWPQINKIYKQYCEYKNFDSVMPLWWNQFTNPEYKTIVYFDNDELVAWTLLRKLDDENIESWQFAWNYQKPDLRLGIKSIEFESAYFKEKHFKYLWLGYPDDYKYEIQGFELVGKLS